MTESPRMQNTAGNAQPSAQDEEKLWKKFIDARFVMLSSITAQNEPYSCPMTLQKAHDGALWFFTSDKSPTAQHLEKCSQVGVSVMDNDDSFYIASYGEAKVSRDRNLMAQFWNKMVEAWFPMGLDDPNLILLRVELKRIEYWDNTSNRMVQMLAIAKSLVTGKPPTDIGDHGELDPEHQPERTPAAV